MCCRSGSHVITPEGHHLFAIRPVEEVHLRTRRVRRGLAPFQPPPRSCTITSTHRRQLRVPRLFGVASAVNGFASFTSCRCTCLHSVPAADRVECLQKENSVHKNNTLCPRGSFSFARSRSFYRVLPGASRAVGSSVLLSGWLKTRRARLWPLKKLNMLYT